MLTDKPQNLKSLISGGVQLILGQITADIGLIFHPASLWGKKIFEFFLKFAFGRLFEVQMGHST